MNKIYNPVEWVNGAAPAINEDNLNAISQGLSDLDDRVIELAGDMVQAVTDCNNAAQDASDYADVASAAATTATTKAGEAADSASAAAGSATTASNKAGEASTSATNADNSATAASGSATSASTNALKSEGYAVGKQNGTDVGSGSDYYQNNAKYYKEQAASSAIAAASSASSAEAWSAHPPYIGDNGNWYVWDISTSAYVDSEIDASITVSVGSTTTLAPGSSATVSNSGTSTDAVFNFGIPQGAKGDTGATPDITVTATADALSSATPTVTVTEGGTAAAPTFAMAFSGLKGTTGATGATPVITATATVDSNVGTPAVTVTKSGTNEAPTLAFAFSNLKGADGQGTGDMQVSVYDSDSSVANAGGIAAYAMAKANPTGTGSFSLNRRADTTVGTNSFVEGDSSYATGTAAHAEGNSTSSSGNYAHSEGSFSMATSTSAHAEGMSTASGQYSHSQNRNTIAQGQNQTALGKFNIAQGNGSSLQSTDYAVIIGNGTDADHRSNALAVQWDGTVVFQDGTTISSANDFSSAEELAELGLIEDFSQYANAVSVKDYGAVGDGVTNDLNAFVEAFADTDYDVILIPRGTYVLTQPDPVNPTIDIELIGNKTIVGENSNLTTLVNANIVAPYGITAKSITFDGGTKRFVDEVGFPRGTENYGRRDSMENKKVTIFATPRYDDASVVYENCVFKNTDIASLAFWGKNGSILDTNAKPLTVSSAKGCTFENITNCGIWHSVNIGSAEYVGNVFKNIGGSTVEAGKVWGLSLGDISSNTSQQVTEALITGNVFDTMLTKVDTVTDTSSSQYNDINANFIAVVAERVIVTGNSLKNLLGYGHDHEGIYTKGNDVEIANNLLIECSAGGEGYICTKKQSRSNMYHYRLIKIHNNIFQGEYGNAIMCYGSGVIRDNDISIRKMYRAIRGNAIDTTGVMADNVAPTSSLIVENNNIICGLGANPNDQSYIPLQVISTGGEYLGGLYFNNNSISIYKQSTYGTRLSAIFKVEKLASDIEIKGNIITQENIGDTTDSAITSGIQLSEYDSLHTVLTAAKKIHVVIEDNRFPMLRSNGFKLTLNTNPYLTKIFSIKGNIIKKVIVSGSSPTIVYPVDIKESSGNTDILTYDSEQGATEINQSKQVYTTASVVYTALNTSTFFEFDGTTPAVYSDDFKDYASKVSSATSGHLAGLDANGNLTDSGKSASDFSLVTTDHDGTASSTVVRKQRISIDGTYYDIDGSVYMEQTVTLSTSADVTCTFTNSTYISSSSVFDIYTSKWGVNPSAVDGPGENGVGNNSVQLTFAKAASADTITVRIYIR